MSSAAAAAPPPPPPTLAVLTTYFDFNQSPWMASNTAYCVRQWREAGAYVILVELALDDAAAPYAFAPADGPTTTSSKATATGTTPPSLVADVVVGCRVRDVMWYKEAALNLALAHVPSTCTLVGWFDNDVAFVPPTPSAPAAWWVDALEQTFAQHPTVSFLQPYGELALTTERVRNAVLGVRAEGTVDAADAEGTGGTGDTESDATDAAPPASASPDVDPTAVSPTTVSSPTTIAVSPTTDLASAVATCRTLARVRKSVMASGGQRHATTGSVRGVTGTAWVARRSLITKLRFFEHAVVGGGDDLQLNLWLGATDRRSLPAVQNPQQHWYFGEGRDPQQAGLRRALQRYRKRLRALVVPPPAKCAYLPCTLVHLYHGELATKQTAVERYGHLLHRGFRASVHLRPHPQHPELLAWADDFRDASLQKDLVQSLERSQSVREQTLLKLAKLQRCLREAHQNVRGVLQLQAGTGAREQGACQELAGAMRACLAAFDGVG